MCFWFWIKKISLGFSVKCVYVSWIVPKHNSNTCTVESDQKRLKVVFRQESCSTEEVSGCCTKKSKSALKYGRQLWFMVWSLGLHPNTILTRVRLQATEIDSEWLFDRSRAPQLKWPGVLDQVTLTRVLLKMTEENSERLFDRSRAPQKEPQSLKWVGITRLRLK